MLMPSSPVYDAGLPSSHSEVEESATRKSDRRGAMLRTAATMSCAALFGVGLGAMRGRKAAFEFAAGYLVEQSLSVDNLFVFIMLFSYFKAGLSLSLSLSRSSLLSRSSAPPHLLSLITQRCRSSCRTACSRGASSARC